MSRYTTAVILFIISFGFGVLSGAIYIEVFKLDAIEFMASTSTRYERLAVEEKLLTNDCILEFINSDGEVTSQAIRSCVIER